jgi:tetrapyrrole methylase family protein/MazG family protein
VVAKLRIECPWDRKQTHKSLGKHLLEESYEVLDAIDTLEAARAADGADGGYAGEVQYLADELAGELGDLLVQVFFHAVIAAEEGYFDLAFVMESIRAKLIRRHPHVFAGLEVSGVEEVLSNWEEIKRAEKEISEPAESVPSSMPALLYAAKVIRKAQAFGYRPPEPGEAASRLAMLAGSAQPESLGELAFALAELAKLAGVDLEAELRQATRDFSARFREV